MFDGSLIQNLDTDHVPSRRRNQVIADIFNRINFMERRGSGFKKIKDGYHKAVNFRSELEPQFYSDATSFWVTLYNLNYKVPIEKVTIEKKKVAIDEEKVAFEERLNAINFTKASKRKIIGLLEVRQREYNNSIITN